MTNKIAILYDFDKTLCTKDMQEYGFIPSLQMKPDEFWRGVSQQTLAENMDSCLSYMYYMVKQSRIKKIPVRRSDLTAQGRDIEFFPGVITWFQRIRDFSQTYGLQCEHYIISSGLKEIIEGTPIASSFKQIYASAFHYNENGEADWPAMAVNYTNKTQFLFRVNKGALDIADETINEQLAEDERPIPFRHMIYIGDGMTDVPCMSLVKQYGGHSIAVYQNGNRATCSKLMQQNRIHFYAKADYSSGSELETLLFHLIQKISIDRNLSDLHHNQKQQ